MSRGHDRERAVRRELESQGWFVARACGSLGDVDLVALRADRAPHLIEVKSTQAGPWHSFGPSDREELARAAAIAGAEAVLAWWPPHGSLTWLREDEWP